MSTVVIVIIAVFILAADIILAFEYSRLAASKGWYGNKYFWLCLLFSFAGYIYVAGLPLNSKTSNSFTDKSLPKI